MTFCFELGQSVMDFSFPNSLVVEFLNAHASCKKKGRQKTNNHRFEHLRTFLEDLGDAAMAKLSEFKPQELASSV